MHVVLLTVVKKQKHDFHFFSFIVKQFLDSVCVMSRIIKVSVRVTETLIILNITKTSSNNNCVLLILFLQLHTVVLQMKISKYSNMMISCHKTSLGS